MQGNRAKRFAAIATGAALAVAVGVPAAYADNGTDTADLRDAVSATGISEHLEAFQAIADANNGNRAAGTAGHVASAEYVEAQLRAAGYDPVRQYFSYDQYVEHSASLSQVSPNPTVYVDQTDFDAMDYSGSGDVTTSVTAVDVNLVGARASTSGCEATDFAAFPAGNIALIQRGTCTFRVKVDNAVAAGASGVIIFNQGNVVPGDDREGLLFGTLDLPQAPVPVAGISYALGETFATTAGLVLRLQVDATLTTINTFNVLADSAGRADRTVVVGGHLDSVAEGPGINDNGSGTASILETAIQLAASGDAPENRVRFAFWSGEEDGLVGSDYYVSQLTKKDIKNHAVNLNFDMVGSTNFVRFVYDGDGDAFGTKGPKGSDVVEDVFVDFFASQGLASEPTAFDGRSDYFGFINNGIPAGGLFTGAEDPKTVEQAAIYGGTAGAPLDPCYHQACDTIDNVNLEVLEQMADAIAHATLTFAETTSAIPGTAKGGGAGNTNLQFKGHSLLK
ncbi:M20/M25/M40 family metallo-hydrolase [Salinibacterium sp. ZJ450]|uniref:M20/M25/M40 family metallo-hydrolase n=1 Tax=Salinibacterium sp. ZJ450 TaxID=2708338 RepID=UPI0014244B7E|nr:M20/M25/M40 family metallo-hydrolase [Salinibacterium sp. ZJ450]